MDIASFFRRSNPARRRFRLYFYKMHAALQTRREYFRIVQFFSRLACDEKTLLLPSRSVQKVSCLVYLDIVLCIVKEVP